MPERIQLRRTKGWRMPANTVKVTRPGPWGNPFIVSPRARPGAGSNVYICVPTTEDAVETYREFLAIHPEVVVRARADLRGKNLACWCKPGAPCHADVLLEIANS